MVQARVDSRNPDYIAASQKRNSHKNNPDKGATERNSPSKDRKKSS